MEKSPKRQNSSAVISREQLEEAILREEIIADVAKQLEKDFGMWGMTITFSNDMPRAYEELFAQVYNHVVTLSIVDVGRLKNLLYQIDISAARVLRPLVQGSVEEELAHKIIERELQKVLLRRYYK